MRKTKWFPASEKPVRVGWYECRLLPTSHIVARWWNGHSWTLSETCGRSSFGIFYWDKWRGLTEEAK